MKSKDIINKMIEKVPKESDISDITCSRDIYDGLNIKEINGVYKRYKGFRIFTSELMPKNYACTGSLYF